jgi:hypothetical protein
MRPKVKVKRTVEVNKDSSSLQKLNELKPKLIYNNTGTYIFANIQLNSSNDILDEYLTMYPNHKRTVQQKKTNNFDNINVII